MAATTRPWAIPVDQFTTDYWFPFYDHGYPVAQTTSAPGSWWATPAMARRHMSKSTSAVSQQLRQPLYDFPRQPGDARAGSAPSVVRCTSRAISRCLPASASSRCRTTASARRWATRANQLTDEYWFPWYDSINMDTSIKVGQHGLGPVGVRGYLHRQHAGRDSRTRSRPTQRIRTATPARWTVRCGWCG